MEAAPARADTSGVPNAYVHFRSRFKENVAMCLMALATLMTVLLTRKLSTEDADGRTRIVGCLTICMVGFLCAVGSLCSFIGMRLAKRHPAAQLQQGHAVFTVLALQFILVYLACGWLYMEKHWLPLLVTLIGSMATATLVLSLAPIMKLLLFRKHIS
jgi:hypothetical protein